MRWFQLLYVGLVVRHQVFLEVQGRKLEMGRGSKDRNGSGRPESGWEYAERNRAGGGRGKALGPSARWRRREREWGEDSSMVGRSPGEDGRN